MSLFKRYLKAATDGEFFYIFREVIPSTNGRREERVIEKICDSVDTTILCICCFTDSAIL